MASHEASIGQTDAGAVVESDGWFVLNVADVAWASSPNAGRWTELEPPAARFTHYGIGIHVLQPGEPNGKYHAENVQEDFLVLSGECLLLVEEQERLLSAWDFFHCSPGTRHILVGAGDAPCAILMVGARAEGKTLHYPVSDLAARYGASTPTETDTAREAYSDWPREFTRVRGDWPL